MACAAMQETRAQRMRRLMVERLERLRRLPSPTVEQIEDKLFLEEHLAQAARAEAGGQPISPGPGDVSSAPILTGTSLAAPGPAILSNNE